MRPETPHLDIMTLSYGAMKRGQALTEEGHPDPLARIQVEAAFRSLSHTIGYHIEQIAQGKTEYQTAYFDGTTHYAADSYVDEALALLAHIDALKDPNAHR